MSVIPQVYNTGTGLIGSTTEGRDLPTTVDDLIVNNTLTVLGTSAFVGDVQMDSDLNVTGGVVADTVEGDTVTATGCLITPNIGPSVAEKFTLPTDTSTATDGQVLAILDSTATPPTTEWKDDDAVTDYVSYSNPNLIDNQHLVIPTTITVLEMSNITTDEIGGAAGEHFALPTDTSTAADGDVLTILNSTATPPTTEWVARSTHCTDLTVPRLLLTHDPCGATPIPYGEIRTNPGANPGAYMGLRATSAPQTDYQIALWNDGHQRYKALHYDWRDVNSNTKMRMDSLGQLTIGNGGVNTNGAMLHVEPPNPNNNGLWVQGKAQVTGNLNTTNLINTLGIGQGASLLFRLPTANGTNGQSLHILNSTANPMTTEWKDGVPPPNGVTYDNATTKLSYNNAGVSTVIEDLVIESNGVTYDLNFSFLPATPEITMSVTTIFGTLTNELKITEESITSEGQRIISVSDNILFNAGSSGYWRLPTNVPAVDDTIVFSGGGNGTLAFPHTTFFEPKSGALSGLQLNYDTGTSTLTLSDPALPTPTIDTTSVVPGRAIMIDTVTITGTAEASIMGLAAGSGTSGPAASTDMTGNNPPAVLIPASLVSPWGVGSSFRVTCGAILSGDNGDRLNLRAYSNRGQTSEVELNDLQIRFDDDFTNEGLTWDFIFTCRTVGATGTFTCTSKVEYGTGVREAIMGRVGVNTGSGTFDTTIDQYLDLTCKFNSTGNTVVFENIFIERVF